MSDDGYTLVEMLAALLILGLALGGLAQGVRMIGLLQGNAGRQIAEARALRVAEAHLKRLLGDDRPYGSTGASLEGAADRIVLECEAGRCEARLLEREQRLVLEIRHGAGGARAIPLGSVADARFVFVGSQGEATRWPPVDSSRQTLQAVRIVAEADDGVRPLVVSPLWIEQAADCEFDPIGRGCREAAR